MRMTSSNADFIKVVVVVLAAVACCFRTPLVLLAILVAFALRLVRWLIIVGLLTSLANSPQTYAMLGWTPLSLLVGDHLYAGPTDRGHKRRP